MMSDNIIVWQTQIRYVILEMIVNKTNSKDLIEILIKTCCFLFVLTMVYFKIFNFFHIRNTARNKDKLKTKLLQTYKEQAVA